MVFLGVRDFPPEVHRPKKQPRIRLQVFLSSGVDTRMTQFEAGLGGSFFSGRKGLVKMVNWPMKKNTIHGSWADIYVPDISINGIVSVYMYIF